MTPPRFRRHRSRDGRQPVFGGDFPDDGRDITEAIQAAPPATWDGTTVPLAGLRGEPRFTAAPAQPLPAWHDEPGNPPGSGYHSGIGSDTTWHPGQYPPGHPATVLPLPQARAVMTVYPPAPGVPVPTPEALAVVAYLRAKVAILRGRGQLDRISDEKLAMLPADRIRNLRTTARLIVDDAAELLRCGGDPR